MSMKSALFTFILSLYASYSLDAVYIVVHGTFAEDALWAQTGGDFFDHLEKKAHERGHHLISFGWSGDNQHKDRVQGGKTLAKIILSYPPQEEKIIIGHSHGGNIIAMASQFLSSNPEPYLGLCKKNREKVLADEDFAWDVYYNALIDVQEYKKSYGKQKVNIDRVYFLGTPIDEEHYMPDMNVIGKLYNFYSRGDLIQPVLGIYKRLLSMRPGIINFRLTIDGSGWLGTGDPSHVSMHDPVLADWVFSIPEELKKKKIGGFELFDRSKNGKIHLDAQGKPSYRIDKKTTQEREKKESDRQQGFNILQLFGRG